MKILFLAVAFFAALAFAPAPASAVWVSTYGYVAVSTSAATAMVSAANNIGQFAIEICNESTGTLRCGYDTKVSVVAAHTNLGFPILTNTCVYRAVSDVVYCKSSTDGIPAPTTVEVYR